VIRAVKHAALWLLLGGIGYLAFDAFLSPKIAHPEIVNGDGTVVIDRSRDQHFYVAGTINGQSVTFLVDTGASIVTVSEEIARRLGLPQGAPMVFETAAGRVAARVIPSANVQVGGIRVAGIRVGVSNSGPALLGQNFLNKVELRQDEKQLTLRVPGRR